jgi:hypothetical protein
MKTALRINTDFTTEVLDLETESYEQLRDAVGGLIQCVDLRDDLTIWVNEEGKLINGMEPNVIGTHLWEKSFGMTDVIMGNIVVTGAPDDEGYNHPLSQAWVVQLQELAARLASARAGEVKIYAGD